MALADIYVLDHAQSFNNEPLHNIYTFQRSTTGNAGDLIAAFIEDVLPLVQQLQGAQIITDSIKAYSLGNLVDLDEVTVNTAGANVGIQILPVFNAVNFSLKPIGRAVRPGSKRISGIPESVQIDGVITDATYLAAMEDLRAEFGEHISDDDVQFWEFCIVKRVLYDVPDTDPVRQAYRFPETDEELVVAELRNVTTTPKVSHQVSRGN